MMDDHYGLRGRPFQLTPDPRFWFDTATHGKAMAYLGYGLSQGEGFVVITGDPGAGKTTLMGHLLGELDGERLNVIKIVSTHLRADDLLRLVAQGLGLPGDDLSKASLLSAIERGLHDIARAGRRTLLVVDEAQALPGESLDELRMLSNFQAGGYPLLQIFLLGQPEFRLVLQQPAFEQLRQRVIAMHHLAPMEVEEVESYLMHRLTLVGWQGRPRFTPDALMAMHRWSGGIPRRLNQLASRVLLYGAVEQIENFGAPDIAAVIDDIEQESVIEETPEPAVAPVPIRPSRVAELRTVPAGSPETRALERRVAELEAQVTSQSDALRRVLSLLVEWVEKDDGRSGIDLDALRGNVA
ncbi:AAA family ATPase [Sphingomonas sp. TDK1]|uniref:AAA family ATPase n=1 Tax=Sphingomonas sp. TDK1 TaxID=453247 RepID=UPI0007DA14BD|nr:AAA family ATPase [Sphingomonas sp. TDK1]OAN64040.1 general secretion pathway protein [Sphingomonas sp. TDK1]